MSDEAKKRSRVWIWALIALFVLYPLSIGPASRLALRTRWEPLLVIYEPIERLHGIGWFDDIMQSYFKIWRAIAG